MTPGPPCEGVLIVHDAPDAIHDVADSRDNGKAGRWWVGRAGPVDLSACNAVRSALQGYTADERSSQVRRERSQVVLMETVDPVTELKPPATPDGCSGDGGSGRRQMPKPGDTPVRKVFVFVVRSSTIEDVGLPSRPNIDCEVGTWNVEPRTLRPLVTPFVVHTMRIPVPAVKAAMVAVPTTVEAVAPDHAETNSPVSESIVSPPLGKEKFKLEGKMFEIDV